MILDEKKIYCLLFCFCIFCLVLSHTFFQNYLFMHPCEQCVYVRLAFCILTFSFIFLLFKPIQFLGFSLAFFGIFYGLKASFKLMQIHSALLSNNPFIASCSTYPRFAFNLPLDRFFPSFFAPTGICALDAPTPPSDITLSTLQSFFTELYAQGWYLIPKFELISMAEASLLIFSFILLIISPFFIKQLNLKAKFISLALFLGLIFLA
ncbi:disulfide bond formation protein B [Campylobacter vulpis]|uniref:disulfide bond formation protein B n=1 Tax=Campylobacter vulpis TaxID=1655500 RepID=UPI001BCAEA7C|nr:disulfide bond formation protein B [Campylobacter vulpis]MBS4406044.1 disulfide bond formation protein B [Campylobacter vulpis]